MDGNDLYTIGSSHLDSELFWSAAAVVDGFVGLVATSEVKEAKAHRSRDLKPYGILTLAFQPYGILTLAFPNPRLTR